MITLMYHNGFDKMFMTGNLCLSLKYLRTRTRAESAVVLYTWLHGLFSFLPEEKTVLRGQQSLCDRVWSHGECKSYDGWPWADMNT